MSRCLKRYLSAHHLDKLAKAGEKGSKHAGKQLGHSHAVAEQLKASQLLSEEPQSNPIQSESSTVLRLSQRSKGEGEQAKQWGN